MRIVPVHFGRDVVGDAAIDEQTNNITLTVSVNNALITSIFTDTQEMDNPDQDPPVLHVSLNIKSDRGQVYFF